MNEQEYYVNAVLNNLLPTYLQPLQAEIDLLKTKNAELELRLKALETKGYTPYVVRDQPTHTSVWCVGDETKYNIENTLKGEN